MPISDIQRAALVAEAESAGIDADALIAEAERLSAEDSDSPDATAAGEPPKLFMYHLPFVKVKEVRQKWLGLTEAFPGDNEVASLWAAKNSPTGGASDPEGDPE